MIQDREKFKQCPTCNSKIFSQVYQIHKHMCSNPSPKKIPSTKPAPKPSSKLYSESSQASDLQNLIPCLQCGENVPFQLYALHEQECIGHQLIACRECGLKFPTFLIQEHNGVCVGRGRGGEGNGEREIEVNQELHQIGNQQGMDLNVSFDYSQDEAHNYQVLNLIHRLAIRAQEEQQKQQGLTKKQLESLESFYSIGYLKSEQDKECAICCTKMGRMQRCVRLGCQHVFHRKCVQPWLEKNPKCPMCRRHALSKKNSK